MSESGVSGKIQRGIRAGERRKIKDAQSKSAGALSVILDMIRDVRCEAGEGGGENGI